MGDSRHKNTHVKAQVQVCSWQLYDVCGTVIAQNSWSKLKCWRLNMQLAALECADEVDAVAQQIGAVNTLVRQQDGTLKGYNTDWSAAISAIERGLTCDEATSSSGAGTASAESSGAATAVDLGAEEATTSGKLPLPLFQQLLLVASTLLMLS